MKTRSIVLALLVCVLGLSAAFAADNPNIGTWKLNEAKSKIPAGVGKNTTVVYSAAAGDMFKVTTDGVDGTGKPIAGIPHMGISAYEIGKQVGQGLIAEMTDSAKAIMKDMRYEGLSAFGTAAARSRLR